MYRFALATWGLLALAATALLASPPVPFSGKLAVDGTNFHGNALFAFSIVDQQGTEHWRHADEDGATVENFVLNGRYLVLLGGHGMKQLPADLFLEQKSLFLRVSVDLQDGQGMRLLSPDQRITSSPYALAAEVAQLAQRATIANGVEPGSVTAEMLNQKLLQDLNRTQEIGEITRDMLPQDVLSDLNRTVTQQDLSPQVRADINATIGMNRLSTEVTEKLNQEKTTTNYNAPSVGSLLAVPYGSDAPAGYSLYQRGEPKELVWEEKAPVSEARYAYDGVELLDDKIYFVGGDRAGEAKNIAERYDPATNSWETLTPMSVARRGGACAVLNGKLYAIGGEDLSSVEVFDPSNGNWSAGVALPSTVWQGSAITVDGKIFLIGGRNASGQTSNQVLCFDPSSDQWITKANMPTARNAAKLVWFENRIWAVGGKSQGVASNDVESYDPAENTWQTEANLNSARFWPISWVANGCIFVGNGKNESFLDTIEFYDSTSKSWNYIGRFPDAYVGAGATILNGSVYSVSGFNGNYLNKVYAADLNASVEGVYDLYRKDGDAPVGTPVVQSEYADGSVTTNKIANQAITTAQLNEQILKYLKPEVTIAPQAPGLVFNNQTVTLLSRAEGKYLTYQWYKNGEPIAGATTDRYVIQDLNKTQHDGNYSLVVSNDFGTVTTPTTTIDVNSTPASHTVLSANNLEMIFCPPGTFMMGSPTTEAGRGADETQHQVTLTNGFYLGKYEVTQAQYEMVMTGNSEGLNAKPSQWPNNNDRPVEQVSWNDVQVFLSRLNDMEQTAGRLPAGWKYVLPTEAQWEYACRAGTTTVFSWGNDINSSRANYNLSGFGQTRDVGQYAANPWGFFDMHGNVWEWVYDREADHRVGLQIDPEGPASGYKRIQKGGGWNNGGLAARSADRYKNSPDFRPYSLGFRLAFQSMPADTANPELTLVGNSVITHSQGIPFIEPGYEAHDARDGNITDQVVVTGSIDENSTGTYLLTYTVEDAAGNTATTATRTVTVTGNRTVDLNATVALDMIWCPPGTFTMGSPTTEAGRDAEREDEHNVSLTKGFYLGKYEVTQTQYEAVMTGETGDLNATPSNWHGHPDRPVEMISWYHTETFLARLNEQQADNLPAGWVYVLPTESQWEYACRAGTTTAYSWGNDINATHANYSLSGLSQTSDVGQYAPNPWGFFDMHGNVREWVADFFRLDYPTGNPVIDPTGPTSGGSRVTRGGSWYEIGSRCRSSTRNSTSIERNYTHFGFRVSLQKSQ